MSTNQIEKMPQIDITDYVCKKLVHIFLQQCRDPKFEERYQKWRKEKGMPDKELFTKEIKNGH